MSVAASKVGTLGALSLDSKLVAVASQTLLITEKELDMEAVHVSGNQADERREDHYAKPKLDRLGRFRELTQCGTSLALLFANVGGDDCVFRGSSSHGWVRE